MNEKNEERSEMRVVFASNPADREEDARHRELSIAILRQCDAEGIHKSASGARLVSLWVGDYAARYLGTAVVQSVAKRAALTAGNSTLTQVVRQGALYGAGQVEAFRRVVLKIPLAGDKFKALLDGLVNEVGCHELTCLGRKSVLRNAGAVVEGNLIAVASEAAASQSIDMAYYMCGSFTTHELKRRSAANLAGAFFQLGTGAAGAAVGTLVLPGIGNHVGGLLGSLAGGMLGRAVARQYIVPSAPSFSLPPGPTTEDDWQKVDFVEDDIVLEPVSVMASSEMIEGSLPEHGVLHLEFDVTEPPGAKLVVHQPVINVIENFV